MLKATYLTASYPERELREELARQCGATAEQVRIWFANRRAAEKGISGISGQPISGPSVESGVRTNQLWYGDHAEQRGRDGGGEKGAHVAQESSACKRGGRLAPGVEGSGSEGLLGVVKVDKVNGGIDSGTALVSPGMAMALAPAPPVANKNFRFSADATEMLKAAYLTASYPERELREELARQCGATAEQVRIWFNNRRQSDGTARDNARRGDVDGRQGNGLLQLTSATAVSVGAAVGKATPPALTPPVALTPCEEEECRVTWPDPGADDAVAVSVHAADGSQLGKLPLPHARLLSRLMNEGHVRSAKVKRVHADDAGVSVRIEVLLPSTSIRNKHVTSQLEAKGFCQVGASGVRPPRG